MRVAIVHDWLYTVGGAERVLAGMLRCFPDADVFCLFDFLSAADRSSLGIRKTTTSFLQRMPRVQQRHRLYLPLMPIAIEQFDLSGYDLVLSSSYAVAKGVLTGPDQLHVSYVHSPMRYAWDLQHQYLRESNLQSGIKSVFARALLHSMRVWDVRTAHGVNTYVANSHFIARRIKKTYGRVAQIVYPPVFVPEALPTVAKTSSFLAVSRLVPYKNIGLIIEAFNALPQLQLTVVGAGPELERLRRLAKPNIRFLGHIPDAELQKLQSSSRALVFAAEEDFGIVIAEVQGQGTPVIALRRGGAREIVVGDGPAATGIFFESPDVASIIQAVGQFLKDEARYEPAVCRTNALRFAEAKFDRGYKEVVDRAVRTFNKRLASAGSNTTSDRPFRPKLPVPLPKFDIPAFELASAAE